MLEAFLNSDTHLSTALEAGNHRHNKGSKRHHYLPFVFGVLRDSNSKTDARLKKVKDVSV